MKQILGGGMDCLSLPCIRRKRIGSDTLGWLCVCLSFFIQKMG